MNPILSLTDLDPLANLLGDWSKELNTGSVIFRVALVVVLMIVVQKIAALFDLVKDLFQF